MKSELARSPSAGDVAVGQQNRAPLADIGSIASAIGPHVLLGLRLWGSVSLALYIAFWLELDNPYWAGVSAALVCLPQLGASMRKGRSLMIGTLVGALASLALTALFPENRPGFLGGLALWAGACVGIGTLLRNFAAYSAVLAGFTVAIIGAGLLGSTGGVNANAAFTLAVARASEICIGIVSADIILAGTQFGGAPRRLAVFLATLSTEVMCGFAAMLAAPESDLAETQAARREFIRRAIALEIIAEQSLGESSQIRHHSRTLRRAREGLLTALSSWASVTNHLLELPGAERRLAIAALQRSAPGLPGLIAHSDPARWIAAPAPLARNFGAAAHRLVAFAASTPSVRLLADEIALVLAGMAQVLNGLALLHGDATPLGEQPADFRLRVADALPAVVNAGRAVALICTVSLFWIVTAWPGGVSAIMFSAITVTLLALRGDEAYASTVTLTLGTVLAAFIASIVNFTVLPGLGTSSFLAFSLVLAVYLIPVGTLLAARPELAGLFVPMGAFFFALLQPTNPMSYNAQQFYNQVLGVLVGSIAGALSFRLVPPLSPAFRARRLLALTVRDVRRLAAGQRCRDWQGHIVARLTALPEEATPLQRSHLLAALSVGNAILHLRRIALSLGFCAALSQALGALARANSAAASAALERLDVALSAQAADAGDVQPRLRARAGILALSEALIRHAHYFDAGFER